MRLSRTLWLYIGRLFFIMQCTVFVCFLAVIYLADLSELLRRASYHAELGFAPVAQMALYKVAGTSEVVLSFSALIACMLGFYGLSRRHELAVMRAAGVSVWQFIAPACLATLVFGILTVGVYNPLAAGATAAYQRLEAEAFRDQTADRIGNVAGNVWLRQSNSAGTAVINAERGLERGTVLQNVVVYQFDRGDRFLTRIKADQAIYEPGRWRLEGAWLTGRSGEPSYARQHWVDTSLSRTQIAESLGKASAISFWDLPQFIQIAERAGLSAHEYRVQFHMLLARPAQFVAIVLLAAMFCLKPPRFAQTMRLVVAGPAIGLSLFLANHVSRSMGDTGALPAMVAAWWSVAFAALIALAVLFYQEDG
jgi:lipopolysaccharide export system permease protein